MQKSRLCIILVLLFVMLFPSAVLADEDVEASDEKTLAPFFLVEGGDGSLDGFPLKDTQVNATINGVLADVYVTQTYANNGTKPINATYVFPASTKASVHGMKMTIGDKVVIAKIKEKEQARYEYEQAKSEGKSASLLEQQRPNVFTMSIANIMPNDTIVIELHYTEMITPTEGVYQFVFPTVVGPRYSSTPSSAAKETDQFIEGPYLHEGELPPNTFNINVRVAAGIPIQNLECTSHKVTVTQDDPSVATVVLSDPADYGGNRDYILNYRLMGKAIQSGVTLYKGETENYFLLMVQPPERVPLNDIPPREYIFVLDVSGSMDGYPLDTAKTVIRQLVGSLRPTDKFNVILFAGNSYTMESASVPATKANIQKAVDLIDNQEGGGGTELGAALQQAVALPKDENYARSVITITDGYIGGEMAIYDVISQNLNGTNFFSFGIGMAVNRYLIEGMAKVGQGEPFVVTDPAQAENVVKLFNEYVKSPVLSDITVHFNGFDAYDIEPSKPASLFAQRPIIVLGKWRGEAAGSIQITGKTAGGDYTYEVPVTSSEGAEANSAIRYLWARSIVERLSYYNSAGGTPDIIKEITALGLKYSILTPYTSFVAVLDVVRNEDGAARDMEQPLVLPANVSDLAVGGQYSNPMSGDHDLTFAILTLILSGALSILLFVAIRKRKPEVR